jgi:hypothetical protein
MAEDMAFTPEWLTKIDVANRLVCAAIRMFFAQSDPVVTHTVISAGHQILTDLCLKAGIETALRGKTLPKDQREAVNTLSNFFKHADRDADMSISVHVVPDMNTHFLMDAAVMSLQLQDNDMPTTIKVYCSWFIAKHPKGFEDVTNIAPFADYSIHPDDFTTISRLLTHGECEERGR